MSHQNDGPSTSGTNPQHNLNVMADMINYLMAQQQASDKKAGSKIPDMQFIALVDFMERQSNIKRPKGKDKDKIAGNVEYNQMWLNLAEHLNSIEGGIHKTAEEWKKIWWSKKKQAKAKYDKNPISVTVLEDRIVRIAALNEFGFADGSNYSAMQTEEIIMEPQINDMFSGLASRSNSPPPVEEPLPQQLSSLQQSTNPVQQPSILVQEPSVPVENVPPPVSSRQFPPSSSERIRQSPSPPPSIQSTTVRAPEIALSTLETASANLNPGPSTTNSARGPCRRSRAVRTSGNFYYRAERLRLDFERVREENRRELERLRIDLESRRIYADQQLTQVLSRLADQTQRMLEKLG